MIAPTIGRRVWYWPSDYDRGIGPVASQHSVMKADDRGLPCDAGICYVWGDRMVNLTVADHNGVMHSRCSVPLIQDGDVVPEQSGYAQWMPYQVQTAKKEEPSS